MSKIDMDLDQFKKSFQ